MPKVRFLEPVYFDGQNYDRDSEHSLSAEAVKALGSSVEVLSKDEKPEVAKQEEKPQSQDATVSVDLLKAKPETDKKSVDAPKADKMVSEPATKK